MKQTLMEKPLKVAVTKSLRTWLLTINLNIEEVEDGYSCDSITTELEHRPTLDDVRTIITDHIDSLTDEKILWGYPWTVQHGPDEGKAVKVWLSKENQNNFKAKHDAALIYPDKVKFPMTYKISENTETKKAIYEVFENITELATFYLGGLAYIESCYNVGWAEKDAVEDWLKDVAL